MAKRVKRTPSLPNITADVRGSVTSLNRALYNDGVEQNYRLNLALPKDGTEPFEAPLPLQVVTTAALPPAADWEGAVIFDTTTNTLKYSNGAAWISLSGAAFSFNVQTFTGSGTYTPTAGLVHCRVRLQAAGGGSGGADGVGAGGGPTSGVASGGGGGGEYAEGFFSAATIGVNQTVTIGAAGTAGTNTGGNGGTAATTSLGSLLTGIGGSGGIGTGSNSTSEANRAGGAGGTGGTGGYLRLAGQAGHASQLISDSATFAFWKPGLGGKGFISNGPTPNIFDGDPPVNAIAGTIYGTGGTGAHVNSTTGVAGAVGGAGIIIIEEFISA